MLLERDDALGLLGAALGGARRSGRLVLVWGEAGIGKSSMVAEFVARHARHREVWWGACDSVVPARPFAPLIDMAEHGGGQFRQALAAGDRNRLFAEFLGQVQRHVGPPRILVFEDLHWADEATLDLLRVTGRRLRELPVLIVGTYREHEVDARHPLRLALGDIPADVVEEIPLQPLSRDAVEMLVRGSRIDAAALHDATGGNPFFVTEVIAAGGDGVPATVRDAVSARVNRLSPGARRVVDAAAVLGTSSEPGLVTAISGMSPTAIEECVDHGVLHRDAAVVSFRHELARQAVLDALPATQQRALHERALRELKSGPWTADVARLAHHALGATDAAVPELSTAAGRQAAAVGSHRQAVAHFANALAHATLLNDEARAALLEAHAHESLLVDDVASGLRSQAEALACRRRVGDVLAEAECLQALSFMTWLSGGSTRAVELAEAAVEILQRAAQSGRPLARAYATLAQRYLVAGDERAHDLAQRALALATGLGDEGVAIHALTTLGVDEAYLGSDLGWQHLQESLDRARAANLPEDVTRALINLVETGLDMWRYEIVERYAAEAFDWLADRQMDLYERLLWVRLAEFDFRRGRWEAAGRRARALLDSGLTSTRAQARALTLVGRLAARRGDEDPWPALDEALGLVIGGDVQDASPLRSARAEAMWLEERADEARAEAATGLAGALETDGEWAWSETAFWAWKTGALGRLPPSVAEPYRLQAEGRLSAAAEAWAVMGCPYQEAVALSDSPVPAELSRALAIFHDLGARPMARRVAHRLAELGVKGIPRGPQERTQRNPHGLTGRELEVLSLIADGLSNGRIAAALVVSPKTIDHHVSAILRKLDVPDRRAAARAFEFLDRGYGELSAKR